MGSHVQRLLFCLKHSTVKPMQQKKTQGWSPHWVPTHVPLVPPHCPPGTT